MSDEHAIASAIIRLMQGVVYREADEDTWLTLERAGAGVRDHFATIGVDVVIDDDEGYAYLRTRPDVEGEDALPRLVRRRTLTYSVSLLLVLLRKRLVEFETAGGEGRLVLTRDQIIEMLRALPGRVHQRCPDRRQVETTIKKAAELGFLRPLAWSARSLGGPPHPEGVRRRRDAVGLRRKAAASTPVEEPSMTEGLFSAVESGMPRARATGCNTSRCSTGGPSTGRCGGSPRGPRQRCSPVTSARASRPSSTP